MMKDSTYNKVKILHHLSSLYWFIQKHALPDAERADTAYIKLLEDLKKDLDKHIGQFEKNTCKE